VVRGTCSTAVAIAFSKAAFSGGFHAHHVSRSHTIASAVSNSQPKASTTLLRAAWNPPTVSPHQRALHSVPARRTGRAHSCPGPRGSRWRPSCQPHRGHRMRASHGVCGGRASGTGLFARCYRFRLHLVAHPPSGPHIIVDREAPHGRCVI